MPRSSLELLILSSHHGQELWVVYLPAVIHIVLIKELLHEDSTPVTVQISTLQA